MKALATSFSILLVAVGLELLLAVVITIIANRTNIVGLAWFVLVGWLVIAAVTANVAQRKLPYVVLSLLVATSFLISFFLFDSVCLRPLRHSEILTP